MLAIIISRNVGNYNFQKCWQLSFPEMLTIIEYGHEAKPSILGLQIVFLAAPRDYHDHGEFLGIGIAEISGNLNSQHFWKL